MKTKKKSTVFFVAMALLLVVVIPASAITHGEPDGDGHPYVGLALFYDEDDNYLWRCTGTLLSKKVFLTAGHCTSGTARARVMFDPDLEELEWVDDDVGYQDCDPYKCYEGDTYAHPAYDDYWSQFPNTYDVGVVVLDRKVKMGEYGVLAESGTLDGLDTQRGHNDLIVRTVGYGLQSGQPWWYNQKIRYTSTSKIVELNSANTGGYGLHTSNNPGEGNGTGGACFGDSGGPIFYSEDSNTVVAVVSWGWSDACMGADYAYRMEIADAQDFVLSFLGGR